MDFYKNLLVVVSLMICITNLSAQEIDPPSEIRREKAFQDIGDVTQVLLPVSAGLTTLIINDEEGFWQFLKAYSTSIAITYALKYSINKPRPEGASDGHAFPSGHTASSFSGASFIQRRYGWKYGAPAYVLAGFVAYSRLEGLNDRHDGWDVLGGALVAIGSTYLFTTPYQKEHFSLQFSHIQDSYLLGVVVKF